MKLTSIRTAVVALLLSGASLTASASPPPVALLGEPLPQTMAPRIIVIHSGTKYVNVVGGETVTFDVGGKSFAWNFDVPLTVTSFDLTRVAPTGALDHPVTVYVESNPRYKHASSNF